MNKAFAIDFIRQLFIQTIREQHYEYQNEYLGKEEDISLVSFYEHLQSDSAVDRFVETVRDLNDQQNRANLIANGVVVTSENPTITNINQSLIIPLSFNMNFRTTLEDRDDVRKMLSHVVQILKGRKWDIAEFDNGELLKVGTLGNNAIGQPQINVGDLIAAVNYGQDVDTIIKQRINTLTTSYGFSFAYSNRTKYLYYIQKGNFVPDKLCVAVYDSDSEKWVNVASNDGNYDDVIFPPEHSNFEKYQVSISFDSENCSEPRTLNAKGNCDIYFGGSATIVDYTVLVGNQITKLMIKKLGIDAETPVGFSSSEPTYYLEPLELNGQNTINSITNLVAHNSMVNTNHNNNMSGGIQYSFIVDKKVPLLYQWYKFGRYLKQGTISGETIEDLSYMSSNIVYQVTELYSCWGEIETEVYYGKVVGAIDVENTESDVMTVGVTMQPQGEIPFIIEDEE